MAILAARVLVEIVLVVILGGIKRGRGDDLGDHVVAVGTQEDDELVYDGLLFGGLIEDGGAVLRAEIGALTVESGGVVNLEEEPGERLIGGAGGVEDDANRFGMAGEVGADVLVGRVGKLTAGVAGRDGDDPGNLLEPVLDPPETAAGENGFLGVDGFHVSGLSHSGNERHVWCAVAADGERHDNRHKRDVKISWQHIGTPLPGSIPCWGDAGGYGLDNFAGSIRIGRRWSMRFIEKGTGMRITNVEREVLRELARQVAEIASLSVQKEKARLWQKVNDLESERPVVVIREAPWHEMNVNDELTMRIPKESKWAHAFEWELRHIIYQWQHMPADMVVPDCLECPPVIQYSGFGLEKEMDIVRTDPNSSIISRGFHPQFIEPRDVEKIKLPVITYDKEKTEETFALMNEVAGDIMPVRKAGFRGCAFNPWDQLVQYLGGAGGADGPGGPSRHGA